MKEFVRSRLKGFLLNHRQIFTHYLFLPLEGFTNEIAVKDNVDTQGVPPKELWVGYGDCVDEYLDSGKRHVEKMFECLGGRDYGSILELGCAAGRMTRHLEGEVWGVDISAKHINWCRNNLAFKFATVTTVPHLPFRDRQFDLVFAGSVFTHIDDLTEAWLAEIARVCRRDVYFTIHDENTIRLLEGDDGYLSKHLHSFPFYQENKNDFRMMTIGRDIEAQVFYRRQYFEKLMSQTFTNLKSFPEAYGPHTAVVGSVAT